MMSIKGIVRKFPLAVKAYNTIATPLRNRSNKNNLNRLNQTLYPQAVQIVDAIKSLQLELPEPERNWKERIEFERINLLNNNAPLNDSTLGDGGLYDSGVSIRQACLASKPPSPSLFLFLLARATKPLNVIELGTNVGISSAYLGAALKVNGQNGKITTLDASPYRQRLAKKVHHNLGIKNISYVEGLFKDTLRTSLSSQGLIDLAFIDGHHQFHPTLNYFEEILAFSTPNTIFIFDDIRWSDGMNKAWSQIQSDNRLGLIVDLCSVGVCIRRQQKLAKRYVLDPIYTF